ncbi:hypothetical protein LTR66_017676, partial [Elasticomyces elasticus]
MGGIQPNTSRPRQKAVLDPLPLIQVRSQAVLRATLETPAQFSLQPKSHRQNVLFDEQQAEQYVSENVEVKRSHKRSPSDASTCSVRAKIFFLTAGPHILQYDEECSGDALPEKILVLDRYSAAFACDVVPNRPWVLQVCQRRRRNSRLGDKVLRPSWSRLTLRQSAEDRRLTDTMLLVFNDSEELYTWLFAIRKEIEHLGGLEYAPDSGEDDQFWRDELARKYTMPVLNDNHTTYPPHSSSRPVRKPVTSKHKDNRARHSRPQSWRSSSSSKHTSTSLDRDSTTSTSVASTRITTSTINSTKSDSSACDRSTSTNALVDTSGNGLSLRSYDAQTSPVRIQHSHRTSASKSLFERGNISVSSLQLGGVSGSREKEVQSLPNVPPTIAASPDDPDAPQIDFDIPQSLAAMSSPPSTRIQDIVSTRFTANSILLSSQELISNHMKNKKSASKNSNTPGKAQYSLFPSRPSSELRLDIASALAFPVSEMTETSRVTPTVSVSEPDEQGSHRIGRSRTLTLKVRDER